VPDEKNAGDRRRREETSEKPKRGEFLSGGTGKNPHPWRGWKNPAKGGEIKKKKKKRRKRHSYLKNTVRVSLGAGRPGVEKKVGFGGGVNAVGRASSIEFFFHGKKGGNQGVVKTGSALATLGEKGLGKKG